MFYPGILINLDVEFSARILNWVQDIDWLILSSQIEKNGSVPAFDHKQRDGHFANFCRLEEVPKERGRFRPWYGDSGGGFEYLFRSVPEGIQITGFCGAARFYKVDPPPLEIVLSNTIRTEIPEDLYKGFEILYPHDNHFKDGENHFGFYGEFYSLFHAWEWYSEDVELFEFSFVPMSIGCLVRIFHRESGEMLDITKDVNW